MVLRLSQCIKNGTSFITCTCLCVNVIHFFKRFFIHTANARYFIKRIACIVLLHNLVHAMRIAKRWVFFRRLQHRRRKGGNTWLLCPRVGALCAGIPLMGRFCLIRPRRLVVLLGFFIPTTEQARFRIVGITWVNKIGKIRVMCAVLFLHSIVLEDVVNHATKKCNVGTRADRQIDVCMCCTTRKARVNNNPFCAFVERTVYPFHGNRMVFCIIAAAGKKNVGVA